MWSRLRAIPTRFAAGGRGRSDRGLISRVGGSVFRGTLGMIDDQLFHGAFGRLQFEAELFLEGVEHGRYVGIGRRSAIGGPPVEREGVEAGEARLIHNEAA